MPFIWKEKLDGKLTILNFILFVVVFFVWIRNINNPYWNLNHGTNNYATFKAT